MFTHWRKRDLLLGTRSVVINLYILPVVLSLNMLEPFLLSIKIHDLVPVEFRNTALGLVTFLGLILSGIAQPIIGAVSDRITKIFKRVIFIMVPGAVALALLLLLIVASSSLSQVFVLYLCFQFSISAIIGSGQTFIPTLIPKKFRGRASGIKGSMEILGAVVGVSILAQFVSQGEAFEAVIIILGSLTMSILTIGIILFQNDRALIASSKQQISWKLYDFGEPNKLHIMLWWMVNRALFWMPIIGIRNLLIFYLEDVKGIPNPISSSASTIAIMSVTILLVSLPTGYLADRLGLVPLLIVAGLASILGIIILMLEQNQFLLLVSGVCIGSGIGIFISSSWALIVDIVPGHHEGKLLAIGNIATIVASATGRLWGPMIDVINRLWLKDSGYTIALLFAIICFAGSIITLVPIRNLQSTNHNTLARRD